MVSRAAANAMGTSGPARCSWAWEGFNGSTFVRESCPTSSHKVSVAQHTRERQTLPRVCVRDMPSCVAVVPQLLCMRTVSAPKGGRSTKASVSGDGDGGRDSQWATLARRLVRCVACVLVCVVCANLVQWLHAQSTHCCLLCGPVLAHRWLLACLLACLVASVCYHLIT